MVTVKVGCCGFPVSIREYVKDFSLAETQRTFYKLPRIETLERWRSMVPRDFEFTVKAWQAITHSYKSPTWRKANLKLSNPERYGLLRPTKENLNAWNLIRNTCDALKARICVVQTPPTFTPNEENIENMKRFLSLIDRGSISLAWEPRGEWGSRPELVRELCRSLRLIHVVDLLRRRPAFPSPTAYIRLHGLGGREANYSYKYRDEDLGLLLSKLKELAEENLRECYVLFNNRYMVEDALRFRRLLSRQRDLFQVP